MGDNDRTEPIFPEYFSQNVECLRSDEYIFARNGCILHSLKSSMTSRNFHDRNFRGSSPVFEAIP